MAYQYGATKQHQFGPHQQQYINSLESRNADLLDEVTRLQELLTEANERAETYRAQLIQTRQQMNHAKLSRLHPGNGDFGPEAFWAEAQKAYEAALRLPEPIHYRPHEDLEDAA